MPKSFLGFSFIILTHYCRKSRQMSQIVENIFSSKKFKLPQKIFLGVFGIYLNVKNCFLNDSRWFALSADFWKKKLLNFAENDRNFC